jgi:competence protein ComEC
MRQPVARSIDADYQPLVLALMAASAGVLLDRFAPVAEAVWWLGALVAWCGWWLAWRQGARRAAALPLVISIGLTAAAWHHCRWSLFAADDVGLLAVETPEPVAIEVRAERSPRRMPPPPYDPLRTVVTPERSRVDAVALAVRDGRTWRPIRGNLALFVNGQLTGIRAGDTLRVFGQIAAVRHPANPGEFDRASHARADRRLCWLSSEFIECVTTLTEGSRASLGRTIDALRGGGDALLWNSLRPERSGLAAAMFLGAREELEQERAEAYMETGTIHLLVISGLNVGILATFLFFVMRALLVPERWALATVAAACLLYAAATDSQPPVVRATVMVLLVCAARLVGRRPWGFNSIAAAGLVVLAINPSELFRHGTQLSFLSVAVLAWFAQQGRGQRELDPLDRLLAGARSWPRKLVDRAGRELGRSFLLSLTIWLVICPLVMARFHLISPIAVLLGPVLGVPVAVAMGSGFGIFALGWVGPVSAALGWLCDRNLAFMDACVARARDWPGNHAWVAGPADWWLAGFYVTLAGWAMVPRARPPWRWSLAIVTGWSALGLAVSLVAHRPGGRLECEFLSVGHGTAVVMRLPDGRTLLYDAGRLGSPSGAADAVAGYLWSRSITHLDAVVLSHADADHYNALPELARQFTIGVVYVSPMMFERPNRSLEALRMSIERRGIPLREIWSGDQLRVGDRATIEVMHPPRLGVLDSDNANSIVLSVEFQGRRVLLTGDLEGLGLREVMAELPRHVDVLLTPHHGSDASDPPGFAEWSAPRWAIVSGAPRDRAVEVLAAYTAHGSRVLHTADTGAVRVTIAQGALAVGSFHGSKAGR